MADTSTSKTTGKVRDAARSQEAILDAAEGLFAERGFDGTSLNDIAVAAGLSRGTPSYFFGSKDRLYSAVLERVFRDREKATREAFGGLIGWAATETSVSLETALRQAVVGYMDFLLRRPSFPKLMQREELGGGRGLRGAPRESQAIEEAFQALRSVSRKRGLKAFKVPDAVLLFVSLTFSPLTQRSTFMASLGRDFNDPRIRRQHSRLVVDQLLHFIRS